MKKYIERDAALGLIGAKMRDMECFDDTTEGQHAGLDTAFGIIEGVPAVDVVEVRHGHWIGEIDDRDGHIWMECSECHKIRIVDDFCGACGTRMDKEDEHEAD